SFRNGRNFSFQSNPTSGQHILKNNISHRTVSSNSIVGSSLLQTNSWEGFTINDSDFVSLDTSLVLTPRNADSSLPYIDLLRLSQNSLFIDAGVDVGLPFNGTAPDLGAFETGPALGIIEDVAESKSFKLFTNYPNPFNPSTTISFVIEKREHVKLSIYDVTGRLIDELVNDILVPNNYSVLFNGKDLSSGIYFAKLSTSSKYKVIKLLLMK
ncbi:MAG TPA: T9SS type A sorting domain-containing protein, partial [Ignavibacteriaceae bacterium]|nr:T9SS type A sorting domain-containing protein [Ignavibacteriaceae bacterium]